MCFFNDPPAGKDGVDSTSKIVVVAHTHAKEKSNKTPKSDGGISMEKFIRDNKIVKENMWPSAMIVQFLYDCSGE